MAGNTEVKPNTISENDDGKEEWVISVKATKEHKRMLEVVAERKYRKVALSHAIRCMIEDYYAEQVKSDKGVV